MNYLAALLVKLPDQPALTCAEEEWIQFNHVHEIKTLEAAIADVLAHDSPALLDVLTNPQELAMPPTITLEQVEGFSLWALRAVINGRGDELIEVAKSNLLR